MVLAEPMHSDDMVLVPAAVPEAAQPNADVTTDSTTANDDDDDGGIAEAESHMSDSQPQNTEQHAPLLEEPVLAPPENDARGPSPAVSDGGESVEAITFPPFARRASEPESPRGPVQPIYKNVRPTLLLFP